MPPRSPTTVGMAVETTVISIAAIDRLRRRETTVSGRLVFIAGNGCPSGRREATADSRRCAKCPASRTKHDSAGLMHTRSPCKAARTMTRAPAFRALLLAVFAFHWNGCGSPSAAGPGGTDPGTGGATFHVDINLTTGLITFPNKYTGWIVGGGSATNFVAYPSGWSVGGGSSTNFVAVPPGWTVGGGSATNFVAYAPGWSVGGGSATNFVAVPSGWAVGGGSATNFIAHPALPGWSAGGGSATNFTALPPGWTTGGGSATNFIALPPGWSVGGGSATNFVGYPAGQGWTVGGGSATNYTALPPGWSAGGGSATNFVAVPPGWVVGGGSATNFVTYPAPSVTTLQVKFDDPGWLGLLKAAQDSASYSEEALADIVMYAFLNLRAKSPHRMEAPAGEW